MELFNGHVGQLYLDSLMENVQWVLGIPIHPFKAPGARPGSAMTSATSSLASLHEQAAPLPGAVRGSWASELLENLWEICGESMGHLWRIVPMFFLLGYPLVKVNITMENHNAIHG